MTISFFAILMILVVAVVAFINMFQGLFSATLSAILAIFSAVLALSYHEVIVEKFLGGKMADTAHGMVLIVLFAGIFVVLRVVFDQVVPGNIRLPAVWDKIGGIVMGVVVGTFAAGIIAVAAQEMPLYPGVLGYARYAVDDNSVTVPSATKRGQDLSTKDQMSSPNFETAESAGELQKMIFPVDDILVGETNRLSDGGALGAGEPLSTIHPNWLQELFGQRLGIEPGAKRVMMGLPSTATKEAYVDKAYLLTTPLPWFDAEFSEVRKTAGPKVTLPTPPAIPTYPVKPNHFLVDVRIRFDKSATDKDGGAFVRISPGAIRLVAPGTDSNGAPADHLDYYPIGTLQYRDSVKRTLPRVVLALQNADDFIFVKTDSEDADPNSQPSTYASSPGADFVFMVDKKALVTTADPKDPGKQITTFAPGTFIEAKRLVREYLTPPPGSTSDTPAVTLLPETEVRKDMDTVRISRKPERLDAGLKLLGLYQPPPSPDGSQPPPTPAPTPAAPAPTPSTPTPAPAPATAGFPLDVTDAPEVSARFFTTISSDRDSGDLTMIYPDGAKGTMTVENGQIHALTIDGATSADMRGTNQKQFIDLSAPLNTVLVKVTGRPKADAAATAWAWKDQINDLALVDAAGARIGPPIGAWVEYTEGGTKKVSARFNTDGGIKFDDLKTAGEVKQVWFVFAVPHPAKIAKFVAGQTTVSEQPLEVP